VAALVDHLGSPIDLVGHSMGGGIASLYAGSYPDNVRSLVIIEGLGPPDTTANAVDQGRQYLRDRQRKLAHRPMADVEEAVQRFLRWNPKIPEPVARRLAARSSRPFCESDPLASPGQEGDLIWTWDPLHRGRIPNPFDERLLMRFLEEITAPTRVIWGAESPFAWPDLVRRQAALQTGHAMTIAGAGHLLHHDVPAELASAIAEHVDSSE
jgi:pimeloyl-ACP methyl ester carboxylesterase